MNPTRSNDPPTYQTRGYPFDPALARAHRAQRKPSRLLAFLRIATPARKGAGVLRRLGRP